MFLRQSIWSTNKILKEIAVLECENAKKKSELARSARSHIHGVFWLLVFVTYTVVYSENIYMFMRRSLAHLNVIFFFFFCRYIWGSSPPPPDTKKLATLLTCHSVLSTHTYLWFVLHGSHCLTVAHKVPLYSASHSLDIYLYNKMLTIIQMKWQIMFWTLSVCFERLLILYYPYNHFFCANWIWLCDFELYVLEHAWP